MTVLVAHLLTQKCLLANLSMKIDRYFIHELSKGRNFYSGKKFNIDKFFENLRGCPRF